MIPIVRRIGKHIRTALTDVVLSGLGAGIEFAKFEKCARERPRKIDLSAIKSDFR